MRGSQSFKTLTAPYIRAEGKYSQPVTFRNEGTLVVSSNFDPVIDDDTDGMWRRAFVFPFDYKIPEKDRDKGLLTRLTSPAGKQAVLAWAAEGYRDYIENGGLAVPPEFEAEKRNYRDRENPLNEWINDCCVRDPEGLYVLRPDPRVDP